MNRIFSEKHERNFMCTYLTLTTTILQIYTGQPVLDVHILNANYYCRQEVSLESMKRL